MYLPRGTLHQPFLESGRPADIKSGLPLLRSGAKAHVITVLCPFISHRLPLSAQPTRDAKSDGHGMFSRLIDRLYFIFTTPWFHDPCIICSRYQAIDKNLTMEKV